MSSIYHNAFFAMGTRFNAILPDLSQEDGDRMFQLMKREISRIEGKLSRFRPDSDVSVMNRFAKDEGCNVDDELFDIMKACVWCNHLTEGAFDITLRPLTEYWKTNSNGEHCSHKYDELRESLGMRYIHLTEQTNTVRFSSTDLETDFGGFGKGYALEKIRDMLTNSNITSAFISFGESSVLAVGNHPAGGAWKIGINDYRNPGSSAHLFEVADGSVSTSGNFFVADNGMLKNHMHVIDPATGLPVDRCVSVSVLAKSAVLAEMMSTAFLVMKDEKIREILDQYDEMEAVRINYESGEALVKVFEKINT